MSRLGSKKPVRDAPPEWVGMLPREVEKKVVELGKEGVQPAVIGLRMRDQFGIPDVKEVTGKKVGEILEAAELTPTVPQDLQNLLRRAINLMDHLDNNRKDLHNLRGLELVESRIRRLTAFHLDRGNLPEGWRYRRSGARLLVD